MRSHIASMHRVIDVVNGTVGRLQDLAGLSKERTSGYCTVKSAHDGRVLLTFQVGECKSEDFRKCYRLVNERADRLRDHIREGHVSSWQSRDEDLGSLGGAVFADVGEVIISFSGLSELADEAVILTAAVFCGWMSEDQAAKIAHISGNQIFTQLKALEPKL